jgi:hypothetical protein
MTKVQIRLQLQKPLEDALLTRISDAHTLYGIHRVQLLPSLDGLQVEYDATRLTPADVEAAFANAGIPVNRPV